MKNECAYARKRFSRLLAGHLFRIQINRIEKHLAACPVCRSEFDALRRIEETRLILRYVEPAASAAERIRAGFGGLAWLKKLIYRPLLLALLVGSVAAVYLYIIRPALHDPDLERLDPYASPQTQTAMPTTVPTATAKLEKKEPISEPAAAVEPVVVVITVEKDKEKTSRERINEAMKEHALLRTMLFSKSVREISGSLTARELSTFLHRIQDVGGISYKRRRLLSAADGELIPFVMRLHTSPTRSAQQPSEKTVEHSLPKSDHTPAAPEPASSPPAGR